MSARELEHPARQRPEARRREAPSRGGGALSRQVRLREVVGRSAQDPVSPLQQCHAPPPLAVLRRLRPGDAGPLALLTSGLAHPRRQRHLMDAEVLDGLRERHHLHAVAGHADDPVPELLGAGNGHGHILPGRPTDKPEQTSPDHAAVLAVELPRCSTPRPFRVTLRAHTAIKPRQSNGATAHRSCGGTHRAEIPASGWGLSGLARLCTFRASPTAWWPGGLSGQRAVWGVVARAMSVPMWSRSGAARTCTSMSWNPARRSRFPHFRGV